jgi:hypothetical protein
MSEASASNASADLGLAAPAAPADQQAAAAKKAELMADPAWVKRKVSGDPEANAQMTELNKVLVGAEADQPAAVDGREIEHLRAIGLSDAVIDQAKNRTPVTQDEHDRAMRLKESLMRDSKHVRAYLDGEYSARQRMALIGIVLSSPVKQSEGK